MSPRETLYSIRAVAEAGQPEALSTIRQLVAAATPSVVVLDRSSRKELHFLLEQLYHTALATGRGWHDDRRVLEWLEKLSD